METKKLMSEGEHVGDLKIVDKHRLPAYRITVSGADGSLYHSAWFVTDQNGEQMRTRVDEFTAMLLNHCFQLTIDDEFVGNFRVKQNAVDFANAKPGTRPILIEVFPTTPQECLDDGDYRPAVVS